MGMKLGITGHWERGLIPERKATDRVDWGLISMGISLLVNDAKATGFRRLNYWS